MYKQVCCCTTPLHPLVVPLLEAFVYAVINPVQNSKSSKNREASFTQRGFTDAEVMSAFAADQQVCEILVGYGPFLGSGSVGLWEDSFCLRLCERLPFHN